MVKYLRSYAARAGKHKYCRKDWVVFLSKRMFAYNAVSKCLGGE